MCLWHLLLDPYEVVIEAVVFFEFQKSFLSEASKKNLENFDSCQYRLVGIQFHGDDASESVNSIALAHYDWPHSCQLCLQHSLLNQYDYFIEEMTLFVTEVSCRE